MTQIELGKKYRTRDGREVRIYAVDGAEPFSVHGGVLDPELGWSSEKWMENGSYFKRGPAHHDLIEVRPRIKCEVWVNVTRYSDPNVIRCYAHSSREQADKDNYARIACVKFTIDCEEGEGLT